MIAEILFKVIGIVIFIAFWVMIIRKKRSLILKASLKKTQKIKKTRVKKPLPGYRVIYNRYQERKKMNPYSKP